MTAPSVHTVTVNVQPSAVGSLRLSSVLRGTPVWAVPSSPLPSPAAAVPVDDPVLVCALYVEPGGRRWCLIVAACGVVGWAFERHVLR